MVALVEAARRARHPGAARPGRRAHLGRSTPGSGPSRDADEAGRRDRYIWRPDRRRSGGLVPSPGPRPGYYLKNFFDEQPALNFGYARPDPSEPWRQPRRRPGPQANRAALREIIGFWCDRGVAGFRVDMAYSLVKDDPDCARRPSCGGSCATGWHATYPDAVLLPESDTRPRRDLGLRSGFDADFFLVIHQAAHARCSTTAAPARCRGCPTTSSCFFDADGPDGPGSTRTVPAAVGRAPGRERRRTGASCCPRPTTTTPGWQRRPDARAARRGVRVPAHLGLGPVDLLRRRDRHALPAGPARPRGQRRATPATTGPAAAPRCSGTTPCPTPGFSTAPPDRLYLPQDPDPTAPDGRRPARRPRLRPAHRCAGCIALRRQHPGPARPAPRPRCSPGTTRSATSAAAAPRGRQPRREPATAGPPALAGRTVTPLEVSGVRVDDGGSRPTASATASSPSAPPAEQGSAPGCVRTSSSGLHRLYRCKGVGRVRTASARASSSSHGTAHPCRPLGSGRSLCSPCWSSRGHGRTRSGTSRSITGVRA